MARQRLNAIREEQLRQQEGNKDPAAPVRTGDASRYRYLFGGIAVGLAIALLTLLVTSLMESRVPGSAMPGPPTSGAAADIHRTGEELERLNARVAALADMLSILEMRLARVMEVTAPPGDTGSSSAAAVPQDPPADAGEDPRAAAIPP